MNASLRNRLLAAGAAGAVAVAGVLVVHHEGTRLQPYRDPVGVLTVCEGITGADVIPGKTYTTAECAALRAKHLQIAEAAVRRHIRTYEQLNVWQQAALIDFTFNLGESRLRSSTLARHFNAGRTVDGCRQLSRWVYGRKDGQMVALRGLVTRRGHEMDMCLNWGARYGDPAP